MLIENDENDENDIYTISDIQDDKVFRCSCCITVFCCTLAFVFMAYAILI